VERPSHEGAEGGSRFFFVELFGGGLNVEGVGAGETFATTGF
jgi:hypothetical protein